MAKSFTHLHVHTEYSLLECPVRIKKLMETCKQQNMTAVAMTDNGVMYGAIEFYSQAKKAGIKPIIGCECYLTPDITEKKRGFDRLILLAKSYKGYQSLINIVSISHLEGFYYKPRIDLNTLRSHAEDLICISPGMNGPVGYPLQSNQVEIAKKNAQDLQEIFQDDFYLGLQKCGQAYEDMVFDHTLTLAKELDLPLVATNNVYYLDQEDATLREILTCIQMGKKLEDNTRVGLESNERYLKSPEAMIALFESCPEAIQNTKVIEEKCNIDIQMGQVMLPNYECPDQLTSEAYLEKLIWEGINKKYDEVTDEIKKRVEYELSIINKMHYSNYFLIIYDFLDYCTQSDIPVGPGRGSAAGSIVAYALDITRIDPLKYNLLFERFLNPERISMPDIDIDFCIKRRGEVIEYIVQKYTPECVSQIATFGTMAARGVIRDVGRVLDVSLKDVDYIAKCIPSAPGAYHRPAASTGRGRGTTS